MSCADLNTRERVNINIHFDKNWEVILYNDNTTDCFFIVYILTDIFKYPIYEAYKLMRSIEASGKKCIAVLPKKLAEKRVNRARNEAKEHNFKDFKIEMSQE